MNSPKTQVEETKISSQSQDGQTEPLKFAPAEEAVRDLNCGHESIGLIYIVQALLTESNDYKAQANQLFASSKYSEAISTYEKAISACPNYLDYELAVLRSNIAACHVQLGHWKAAVKSATTSLEALNRLDAKPE